MTTEAIEIGGKTLIKYGNAEHSIIGGNRFYLYCDFHHQRRCYGVCAGAVDAFLEQRQWVKNETSETGCVSAMRKGKCAAIVKRQLEVKLNASLFYVSKDTPEEKPIKREESRSPSYWVGWNKVGSSLEPKTVTKQPKQPKPVASTPKKPVNTSISYADAINEALKA